MIITAFTPFRFFAQTPIFSVSPSSFSLSPIQQQTSSSFTRIFAIFSTSERNQTPLGSNTAAPLSSTLSRARQVSW